MRYVSHRAPNGQTTACTQDIAARVLCQQQLCSHWVLPAGLVGKARAFAQQNDKAASATPDIALLIGFGDTRCCRFHNQLQVVEQLCLQCPGTPVHMPALCDASVFPFRTNFCPGACSFSRLTIVVLQCHQVRLVQSWSLQSTIATKCCITCNMQQLQQLLFALLHVGIMLQLCTRL